MLHIILLILKIIGWILLAILGFAVLLICITLFVPLRYRADASCKGTFGSLYARMRFSWLLHLVSGYAVYDGGKLDWTIRIAWKKIKPEEEAPLSDDKDFPYHEEGSAAQDGAGREGKALSLRGKGEETQDKAVARTEKTKAGGKGSAEKEDVSDEGDLEKIVSENREPDEDEIGEMDARILNRLIEEDQTEDSGNQITDKKEEDLFGRIGKLYRKIRKKLYTLYKKIKYTFHKICDTIESLLEKKEKLAAFISEEAHKSAFFALLAEVKRLLRFLKPRTLKADIHFGFEDPGITGRVLAALSMAYPFIGNHVDIEPDFEEKVLEGDLLVAGKIRGLYAVLMLWNLVWNRDVRTTLKHLRNFEL